MRRLAAVAATVALLISAIGPAIPGDTGPSERGHPGCPWKGGEPCPHGHDMQVAGSTVTPCPADGSESPAHVGAWTVFPPPVEEAALELHHAHGSASSFTNAPSSHRLVPAPDPPPPRSTAPA